MFRHRYFSAIAVAAFLIFLGYAVVMSRSAISPNGFSNGIDIDGVIQAVNPATPIPSTPQPIRPTAVDVPYTKITPPPKTEAPKPPVNDGFNWNTFIASLSLGTNQIANNTTAGESGLSDAYAFVPTGLISPDVEQPLNTMSPTQQILYGWGTDVGSAIQSYENSHPDQAAILTNHMQDRENPDKIAALKRLASDLKNVADSIDRIGDPPPEMRTAGPGLSAAYRDIADKLSAVGDARGDEATVKAILTYNAAAESFVQKYVAVAIVFQLNGVRFAQDTPGGVFMFPGN